MFKFSLAIVLFCSQAYARPDPEISPSIVGGSSATEGQFPFAVAFRRLDGSLTCGGALISNQHVLTAGRCVYEAPKTRVGVGSIKLKSQKLYDIEKSTLHPEFDAYRLWYDLAVVKLKEPVQLSSNVKPINISVTEILVGKTVTGVGWGQTTVNGSTSEVLMHLSRKIITNIECSARNNHDIKGQQICWDSDNKCGMCGGDVGNPIIYKDSDGKTYLAGIFSWTFACAGGFPNVFVRVSTFAKWIKNAMV